MTEKFDEAAKPIWDVIAEIGASVPPDVWDVVTHELRGVNAELLEALEIARDYVAAEVLANHKAWGVRLMHRQKVCIADLAAVDRALANSKRAKEGTRA